MASGLEMLLWITELNSGFVCVWILRRSLLKHIDGLSRVQVDAVHHHVNPRGRRHGHCIVRYAA